MRFIIKFISLTILSILLFKSCLKDRIFFPDLTTMDVTSVTLTSAISGGAVIDDGGASILERGVCWNILSNPTISNYRTIESGGLGLFSSNLSPLNPNTYYYARAYATNKAGTGYGNQVIFITDPTIQTMTVKDIEGNTYNTVKIGTQVWMVENLKTTKYNDGSAIPNVTDDTEWANLTTPAYCWYNNDIRKKTPYGALYNFYAVSTGKLCPTGWHVPSDVEWTTLTTYLGGESVAGGKLKEAGITHYRTPNTGATNETGFTALPGGHRYYYATFVDNGLYGDWWSSTEISATNAWTRSMDFDKSIVRRENSSYGNGYSVRCLKD
ncbi:MAG: fibrobacter succinogenes major paralogous domain-containing protein [Bacteroidales bacterium]|nr:fibrobacter succinogenes major paralogous domain-containing protein [Bacteroidales bacterium]